MHAVIMSHTAQCSLASCWEIPGFCTKVPTKHSLHTALSTQVGGKKKQVSHKLLGETMKRMGTGRENGSKEGPLD